MTYDKQIREIGLDGQDVRVACVSGGDMCSRAELGRGILESLIQLLSLNCKSGTGSIGTATAMLDESTVSNEDRKPEVTSNASDVKNIHTPYHASLRCRVFEEQVFC